MIFKFFKFLSKKKKYWLGPMLFTIILLGVVTYLSQDEVSPFFYIIFEYLILHFVLRSVFNNLFFKKVVTKTAQDK